ncbi:MAG: tryptophan-rich sensory protein [Flavobacteriaceae bacterium]|nr:tryptophan-rich sensory protein [Flavobacteriaceae bacterium]
MDLKVRATVNLISVIAMLTWNALAQSLIYEKDMRELSATYNSFFTPSPYAFSIWGLIFLALLAYALYPLIKFNRPHAQTAIQDSGIWFWLANLLTIVWVHVWMTEQLIASVIIMVLLLLCLIQLMLKHRLEIWDAPIYTIILVWWPILLYLSWISVATVANIAAVLNHFFKFGLIEEIFFTILMLFVVTALGIIATLKRNLREMNLVFVWAFVAIALKNWDGFTEISYAALVLSGVLLMASAIHGYKNRATAPPVKWHNYLKNKSKAS